MTRQEANEILARGSGKGGVIASMSRDAIDLLDRLPDWAIDDIEHFSARAGSYFPDLGKERIELPRVEFYWSRSGFKRNNPGGGDTYIFTWGEGRFSLRSGGLREIDAPPALARDVSPQWDFDLDARSLEIVVEVLATLRKSTMSPRHGEPST